MVGDSCASRGAAGEKKIIASNKALKVAIVDFLDVDFVLFNAAISFARNCRSDSGCDGPTRSCDAQRV